MAFLDRVQQNLATAKTRPSVKDQLKDEEQPVEEDIWPPKRVSTKKPAAPEDQQKAPPAEEPPAEENKPEAPPQEIPKEGLLTGAALLEQEGRFAEVKQSKPYLFVVSGVDGKLTSLMQFLASAQTILNNPKLVTRIAGPGRMSGNERRGLDMTLAYLVGSNAVDDLTKRAAGLPVTALDFRKDINKTRPFDAVALAPEIESKLGDDARRLRATMQQSFETLISTKDKDKGSEDPSSMGEVSALQMQRVVPLDYMRFLSKENQEREFYIGGSPEGAGQNGMLYVLSTREESNLLLRTMKDFHPLPNFIDGLYWLPDIDSGFKTQDPKKIRVDNCLILTSKTKFEIGKKLDLDEKKDEKVAASVEVSALNLPFFKKKILKGPDESKLGVTVLEALNRYGQALAGRSGSPAGKFVKGTHVQGTLVTHFSKDFKKCILWCGENPIPISPEMEAELSFVFDLTSIDKTFSR